MNAVLRQFGRTIVRSFDWHGRSRREEVLIYLVLSQAAMAILSALVGWLAPEAWAAPADFALGVLVLVPAPALVIRRLHDFAASGKWGFILLVPAVRTLGLDLIGLLGGWSARSPVEAALSYVDWLLTLPFVVMFLLILALPGSKGANRFGPNPRGDGAENADEPVPNAQEQAPAQSSTL